MSKKQNVKPNVVASQKETHNEQTNISAPSKNQKWLYLGITILFLAIVWFARTNLLSLPFERDEGSYSYMGQLLLEGQKPYIDFYEMKLPGIFYCYAMIVGIFGKTPEAMHLGFGVMSFISAFFIWHIAKQLFCSDLAAMTSTVAFAILSLVKQASGFAAQGEHIVVLFSTLGILLTLKAIESGKFWQYILAGIALGMAFSVKQTGGFFALAAGILVILANLKPLNILNIIKNGIFMAAGFIAIVGVFVSLIISKGAYNEMMYWTFDAAKNYVGALSFDQGMELLSGTLKSISNGYIGFWLFGVLGLGLIWLTDLEWYKKVGLVALAILAFGSVTPGLRFYGHYFLQFMPGLALLVGAAIYSINYILVEKMKLNFGPILTTAAFLLIVITAVANQNDYYFAPNEFKIMRESYGDNPFIETDEIGKYIKAHSRDNSPIAVFGSEPQLYFQTQRHCPHRHSFMSFTSPNTDTAKKWREEVKEGVEKAAPEYIVLSVHPFSWSFPPDSDQDLFKWALEYTKKNNYDLVGVADIASNSKPIIIWEAAAQTYKPQGKFYLYTFRKKA